MSTDLNVSMMFFCCDDRRRSAVRAHATLNGIDYLEVIDHDAPTNDQRQRVLVIHLLKPFAAGPVLTLDSVEISGGVRIVDIQPRKVKVENDAPLPVDRIVVTVDKYGDFSTYTLRLIEHDGTPLAGFDPLLTTVDFSFKVECESDFDCRQQLPCPVDPPEEPEIDYLAKDFSSFRQLMLDRLSVIIPDWKERNLADLGITLVELLAYVGDNLSYQQDAIATEAYLGTARRRTSIRRHARLVDYFMSDGCNARVWVQLCVNAIVTIEYADEAQNRIAFLTRTERLPKLLDFAENDYRRAIDAGAEVFEPMQSATLYPQHNTIHFYTWGDRECCLPRGATRAALSGALADLKRSDVLIFEERIGPRTGDPADADRTHRHAVRLTRDPVLTNDPVLTTDPLHPDDESKWPPVTLIEWGIEDALPFPFCISALSDQGEAITDVSVALGNIVLADHGRTISAEQLGTPKPAIPGRASADEGQCGGGPRTLLHERFRPRLKQGPLTIAGRVSKTAIIAGERRRLAFDPDASAIAAFRWDMNHVAAEIILNDADDYQWRPQRDLLSSDEFAHEFVTEIEEDGRATLRFGDDTYGRRPTPGVAMEATYRVGNGTEGNVGSDSLAHVAGPLSMQGILSSIERIYNPLPARGGVDPESSEHVRQSAPAAFFTQERAVTSADYAEVTQRNSQVQRSVATMRWTGSWRTVFVTVDRMGGGSIDASFEREMRTHIERYRMAGHDIEVDGPRFVPLEIEMKVCVVEGYFRSDVKKTLLEVFSNRSFPDGRRGFFHPDAFTFGQPVYLSKLYEAAQSVAGVASVEFTSFKRVGCDNDNALAAGLLVMSRLEIAQLDNDRNLPENGTLRITMGGGR